MLRNQTKRQIKKETMNTTTIEKIEEMLINEIESSDDSKIIKLARKSIQDCNNPTCTHCRKLHRLVEIWSLNQLKCLNKQ